ncbi:MAG: helix-turn-helix domain-containing protein [Polaromonas sp.]|uniref:helix-turn-helix domain-containing protein n=1 Tax=Polaromonas sp. TaxID=1869339 RepID=UPI003265FA6F
MKAAAAAKGSVGSSFDDFLEEEGLLQEVVAAATKRVVAWQLDQAMREQKISKTALAQRMGTSRAALDRLLDEADISMTLGSLAGAAAALGKSVRVELV